MKAKFATRSAFASLLLVTSFTAASAFASSGAGPVYKLSCTPSGGNATAMFTTTVEVAHDSSSNSGLSAVAVMNLSLQDTDGSAPFVTKGVRVRGQIQDAANTVNNQPYQVLFAQPLQGCNSITYARIAIGDNVDTGLPNSYIRSSKGVYFYAHCQQAN